MSVLAAAAMLSCTSEGSPPESETTAAASICSVRSAGDPWWIATFPQQTGQFHFLVQATPQANNMDAVIGLSQSPASTWSHLAAIVRFAPSGRIDVRNGGAYTADTNMTYSASSTYIIRFDVDLAAKTYSVGIRQPGSSSYARIATNYAFRTEQAGVTSLASAGVYVDTTAPGSIEVCDLDAIADDTTPDGCVTSTAGASFANGWMPPVTGAMTAKFHATPSANLMDGVVGYTTGAADGFSDFIASVRFSAEGMIEARDGDVYRAATPMTYTAGQPYRFEVVLDFATGLYSVYASEPYDQDTYTLIADNFRFRPQQANAELIDNLATVVDSPEGQVRVCGFGTMSPPEMQHVRTGRYLLAPFRDGRTVVSDGITTQVLDSAGETIASAGLPAQKMTVDASGNIYIATSNSSATELTLRSVTSALQPRWVRTFATEGGLRDLGVYDDGRIALALGAPGYRVAELVTLTADGEEASRVNLRSLNVSDASIGRDRFAIGFSTDTGVFVQMHAPDGSLLWQRSWTGTASVYEVTVEPNGSLLLGGLFGGEGIDFGAGFYPAYSNPEFPVNGFMVALSASGGFRFANRYYTDGPMSLASSGDIIAYATTQWSQMQHPQLWVYTSAGTELRGDYVHLVDDSMGIGGDTIVASDGRVLMNVSLKLHPSNNVPLWPILATFVY